MALPRYTRFYNFDTPLANTRYSRIELEGGVYNSVEQYFDHHMAKYFGQEELAEQILSAKNTPMDCFRLGMKVVVPKEQQTPDQKKTWIVTALDLMEKALRAKVQGGIFRILFSPIKRPLEFCFSGFYFRLLNAPSDSVFPDFIFAY